MISAWRFQLGSLSDIDRSTTANDVSAAASFSALKNPQRIPVNTLPVFRDLWSCICRHLLYLVTNGNVGQAPSPVTHMLMVGIGMGVLLFAGHGRADACTLSPDHAGLTFPVERVDPVWSCRLQAIVQSHTTESKVGPIRTALSEALYRYLLDHPPFTATLIRRLHLGLYQSEVRGLGRFWGDDGAGTKGIVELVYEDPTSRIYFLEGTHESRLLPHVTGKAVVLLRIGVMRDANAQETTESTLVAYTKLDNRVLSGLVSLLHPLVSRIVTSRIQQAVEMVDRLGMMMKQDPQRVMAAAESPSALPELHVAFLKQVLSGQQGTDKVIPDGRTIP